jgi:hypothetical protein
MKRIAVVFFLILTPGFAWGQVHVRQDIANLTPAQLASLQKGFQAMMQRSQANPNDPTGLLFQANMHGTESGEMAADMQGGCPMGDPGQPLWDQCQHYSYFFLSWHRMYLYYFEKILRQASGDPHACTPVLELRVSRRTNAAASLSSAPDRLQRESGRQPNMQSALYD